MNERVRLREDFPPGGGDGIDVPFVPAGAEGVVVSEGDLDCDSPAIVLILMDGLREVVPFRQDMLEPADV